MKNHGGVFLLIYNTYVVFIKHVESTDVLNPQFIIKLRGNIIGENIYWDIILYYKETALETPRRYVTKKTKINMN